MGFELNPKYKPGEGRPIKPDLPLEKHHNLVNAGIHMLGMKEKYIGDIERLMNEATARVKNINDYAYLVFKGCQDDGIVFDPSNLRQEVHEKYLNNFVHYNKDELLIVLATFMTYHTMKKIV